MNWLNIETKTLRSPEYIGAEPVQRATWLNLLGYCAEQENGGRIAEARQWKDRRWMQTCGVTLSEVDLPSSLWLWEGDCLVVWNYPVTKEEEVRAKRDAGKKGGKASGEARREAQLEAVGEAVLEAVLEAPLERKGKERKGKEGERKGTGEADASPKPSNARNLRKAQPIDDEYLAELKEIYTYANIAVEFSKAKAWCDSRSPKRTLSRQFFVNWLNKISPPPTAKAKPISSWTSVTQYSLKNL